MTEIIVRPYSCKKLFDSSIIYHNLIDNKQYIIINNVIIDKIIFKYSHPMGKWKNPIDLYFEMIKKDYYNIISDAKKSNGKLYEKITKSLLKDKRNIMYKIVNPVPNTDLNKLNKLTEPPKLIICLKIKEIIKLHMECIENYDHLLIDISPHEHHLSNIVEYEIFGSKSSDTLYILDRNIYSENIKQINKTIYYIDYQPNCKYDFINNVQILSDDCLINAEPILDLKLNYDDEKLSNNMFFYSIIWIKKEKDYEIKKEIYLQEYNLIKPQINLYDDIKIRIKTFNKELNKKLIIQYDCYKIN
jgi:hypothetical protein